MDKLLAILLFFV